MRKPIENLAISNDLSNVKLKTHPRKNCREFRRDREPSRIPVRPLEHLRNKSRKLRDYLQTSVFVQVRQSPVHWYVKVRKASQIEGNTKKRRNFTQDIRKYPGGGYSLIWAIRGRAALQGTVFWPRCPKQCQNLSQTGYGITSRETFTQSASRFFLFLACEKLF